MAEIISAREWIRREKQTKTNRVSNGRLLDIVLDYVPASLGRQDYQMLVLAGIERLDFEDWEAMMQRHAIRTDESREPDAATHELQRIAKNASEPELIRMLFEMALLRSAGSDEELGPNDPLISTARRIAASTALQIKGNALVTNSLVR